MVKIPFARLSSAPLRALIPRNDLNQLCKGFHGDNCATVGVGTVDAAGQRLMDATQVYIFIYIYQYTFTVSPRPVCRFIDVDIDRRFCFSFFLLVEEREKYICCIKPPSCVNLVIQQYRY